MSLSGKKVLVGLTGGIACYKIPYLIRALAKASAEVRVIMTEGATKFITPLTLETLSGNPVGIGMFPGGEYVATRHIDLVDWAELLVIAPATANFLGKAAGGISDNLLMTIVCACRKPILVAPAMNPGMWTNPVTQKNVTYLGKLGYNIVGPNEGDMACDHVGFGRMAEPDEIFEAITALMAPPKKKSLVARKS